MRKALAITTLVILLSAGAIAGPACHPSQASDLRLAREVLVFWNDLGRKLVEMAEDFPEERYGYRPTPEARGFAEILHHVAEENYVYLQTARGERVDRDALSRRKLGTRTELTGFLKESFDQGGALVANTTDAQMLEQVTTPYGKRLTRMAFWLELVQHAAEHYGNLVTYYRLTGMIPPETRRARPAPRP
ncbi:MAG: DinB family protein [Vicinamibacterales bacterium]